MTNNSAKLLEKISEYCDRNYKILSFIIIAIVMIVFICNNALTSFDFTELFGNDAGQHHATNLFIKKQIENLFSAQEPSKNLFAIINHLNNVVHRPPVYFLLTALVDFFVKDLLMTELYYLPIVFLLLAVLFTFKTGEYLAPGSGLFAVLLLCLFPGTILNSQGLTLYAGQTAFTIISFYYFFKSEVFTNKKNSIIFGMVFGLGTLTKAQFPIFFIGPFAIIAYTLIKNLKQAPIKNIIFSFAAFLLSGVLVFTVRQIGFYGSSELFMPSGHNLFKELSEYIIGLKICLTIPFICVWVYACIKSCRANNRFIMILASSTVGSVLFFSLFDVRGDWTHWFYMSPALPSIAIVIAVYLKKYKDTAFRIILIVAVLAYPLVSEANAKDRKIYSQIPLLQINSIAEYLQEIDKNKTLKIGIMRDSWEMFLSDLLAKALKPYGNIRVAGGKGYPDSLLLYNNADFDVFIFVHKNKKMKWPTNELFMKQYAQLLSEHKTEETRKQIDRITALKDQMHFLSQYTSYLGYESAPVYITVYVHKTKNRGKRNILQNIAHLLKGIQLKTHEWY